MAISSHLMKTKPLSLTRPLSGWRVALNDTFDLKGVKSSFGSTAYLERSQSARQSAAALEMIAFKGVQIVGKTKLSMFSPREALSEAVDCQTSCNPRGDGYQVPYGGSSGSAVAVAAYEWIDIGISTDSKQ